jgi:alkylated DNA repair protein (DNA oxidative demethylase)
MRTLFAVGVPSIEGFRYEPDFISRDEELALVSAIRELSFATVTFRGVEAKRRVVQFGWDYRFETRKATPSEPIPSFLVPLQQRVGAFVGIDAQRLEEILVTEYQPGAAIGWHRDAPPFRIIVGVSLLSSCRMRFKPMVAGRGDTLAIELEPRSVYVFAGAARSEWQHSIPPAKELRYSITFRTLRSPLGSRD